MQKKQHCICIIFFPDKDAPLFLKNVVKVSDFFCHHHQQKKTQFQISIWYYWKKIREIAEVFFFCEKDYPDI